MLTLVSTSPPRSFPAGSPPSWLFLSMCWGLGLLLQPAQVPLEGSSTLLALQVVSWPQKQTRGQEAAEVPRVSHSIPGCAPLGVHVVAWSAAEPLPAQFDAS